jgi:hypothetical protein
MSGRDTERQREKSEDKRERQREKSEERRERQRTDE